MDLALAPLFLMLLAGPLQEKNRPAEPPQITLQNNSLPGHYTTHDLQRTLRRTIPRGRFVETLSWAERGNLVQCNVSQPQSSLITCYQMVIDQPAKVLKLFHDATEISPAPPAAQFNLSRGSAKLSSTRRTVRESVTLTPSTDPAEAAVLATLLDVAYWQNQKISGGHKWERLIHTDAFEGRQVFEFIDLGDLDHQTAARISVQVTGAFKGVLDREYSFIKANAMIYWSRLDRHLLRLDGVAEWTRNRRDCRESYDLQLEVALRSSSLLGDSEQELMKEQLSAFAEALDLANQGNNKEAVSACHAYRKSWPHSVWMPAIDELQAKIAKATASEERMSGAQLKETINRSVVTYEAARLNRDSDLLDLTASAMVEIAKDYGATLGKLCRDRDENVRATAAFALAFGTRAQDGKAVAKCVDDSSSKVRSMALMGLAASANPQADAEMLLRLLDDSEASVRRRSLQVITACIQRENFAVAKLVERIDRLMVYDKTDGVRSDAVDAIVAIGAPSDIPRLEGALKHELNLEIREKITQGIQTLRSRT